MITAHKNYSSFAEGRILVSVDISAPCLGIWSAQRSEMLKRIETFEEMHDGPVHSGSEYDAASEQQSVVNPPFGGK